jgi:hypothetical protein
MTCCCRRTRRAVVVCAFDLPAWLAFHKSVLPVEHSCLSLSPETHRIGGHKNPFFLSENSTRLTHRCSSHTSFFLPTALHAWAWGLGLERRMVGGGSRRGSAIIAIASSPPPRTDGAQQRRAEPRTALAPLPQPARTTRADPRVTPRCRRRRTSAARGSRATATAAAISLEISRHTRTQHRSRSPSRPRLLRGDCRRIPPPR